jgi:hypothetical protein
MGPSRFEANLDIFGIKKTKTQKCVCLQIKTQRKRMAPSGVGHPGSLAAFDLSKIIPCKPFQSFFVVSNSTYIEGQL